MNSSEEKFPSSPTTDDSLELEPLEELIDLLLEQNSLPKSDRQTPESSDLVLEDSKFAKSLQPDSDLDDSTAPIDEDDFYDPDSQHSDLEIKVEIEDRSENLTLEQAVEYEAFLRQTVASNWRSQEARSFDLYSETRQDPSSNTAELENEALKQLEDLSPADSQELVEVIDALIPLIVELVQSKLEDSQTEIIETVRPVIDRLITERIAEDSQKMATAIAPILPSAISEGINLTPEAIAKAIAPEIALSIAEQIRLDENSISQTLGPEMGKAIATQIELERDAMVDALYPVIGSTISKYMVEVVRDINDKVESTLSPQGIKRKIRAKIQGVSEAELIFQESVGYCVRALFLIAKDSGLVIQEIQQPGEKHLDSEMVAGMLTAIRSFANDCITSGSELDTIDYGDWQIPLEVAGYCYLAVVVRGEPTKQFRNEIRRVLGEIVLEHGNLIKCYNGNLANIPPEIETKLEQLIQSDRDKSSKSSPPILLWLMILFLGAIFVPWGIINYRARTARQIERTAAVELDAAPELSVYRLEPEVSGGELTVTGRVPSQYLSDRAAAIVGEIARQNDLILDNRITTVEVPVNPSLLTGEVQRLTELFNQRSEVAIAASYQSQTLTITGFVFDPNIRQTIARAFGNIPGVERVIFDLIKLPLVEQRIYFESGAIDLNADNFSKINAVKQLLVRYPQLHLKLIAHSDGKGSREFDRELGKKRCQTVKAALVAKGIESNRVTARCDSMFLPANISNQQAWTNRYVGFEPFIPMNLPQ